ncbi:MAG: hypothetical protein J0J01_17235 [Reyranella sp.]|uniref:hypothetical protein n=1 Tax=Reyranella sp. TaxID=1929291 RepID=UPI001AD39DEC|nr:hypothetical protein [Reyranella sp.]MBN9088650.1 hypothetical protein [Reyranella sp.]
MAWRDMTAEEIASRPELRLGGALFIAPTVSMLLAILVLYTGGVHANPAAVLAETALAAGFCGYMAAGVRPNAYYRRRLPTA